MKRILSVLLALVMVIGLLPMSILSASAAELSATLTFDANKTSRTEFSASKQVWVQNGITLTNEKANSSNDVADYANPVRLYAGSTVTISCAAGNITKIDITSNGTAKYKTALEGSLTGAGYNFTNSGNVYTVTMDGTTDSFTMSMTGQARFHSLTVYYATSCTHPDGITVAAVAATCTEAGHNEYIECPECGDVGREDYPALGHSIVLTDSTITCEACELNTQLNTIAEAKAYTDATVYYLKGIVTYVSGSNVYIQDATGGVCVYFASGAAAGIAVGDEILVWGSMTVFHGLIEVNGPTAKEYQKLSSGNELPLQEVTIAELLADTTNEYLGERVIIKDVTLGTADGNNTPVTSGEDTINIFKIPTLTGIASGDTVTVTAIVGTYDGYQLLVASADDITPCVHESTTTEGYVAPSCTEPGQTGTTTCNTCGKVVTESTEIEATGHAMVDGVCTVCGAKVNFALYTGGELVGSYLTFEEAWEDYDYTTYTSYIQLLADVEVTDGELQDILYLDLNGYDLSGTINADGYMVCVMDSTTNEYNGDNVGYLNVDFGEDVVASQWTTSVGAFGEAMNFMAITDENGTSFHRYYVGITHTSLNTAKKGVGYKALFCGDDAVKALLDAEQAFGYTLTLEGGRTASRWQTAEQVTSGKYVTLRVNNYDIANYGEAKLSAYVSINLNGEEITSAVHELTMHEMMDTINANYASYDETQLAAIADMIAADETLQSWCLYNIGGLAYMTNQQLVDLVEGGTTLGATVEMTGIITSIESYNDYYNDVKNPNVKLYIAVSDVDVELCCYQMLGDVATLQVGDQITVSGNLTTYHGAAQFDSGCTMTAHTSNYVAPETVAGLIDAATALISGMELPGTHTLTGVIYNVETAYSSSYGNVTVDIAVDTENGIKVLKCYRLKGTGADVIAVGDTITVTGTLTNYSGAPQFDSGCTLDSYVQAPSAAEIVTSAFALEAGAELPEMYILSGVVASVDTAYDEAAGVIGLTITCEGKAIKCAALAGKDADLMVAGDNVTVVGLLSNADDVVGFHGASYLVSYKRSSVDQRTYTFADFTAGGQYAANEVHVLDEVTTVTVDDGHFTTQLRLYDSSSNDSTAIFECAKYVDSIAFNMGHKKATLNVYGSTDGTTWQLIEAVATTSTSYLDYTVNMGDYAGDYNYIKLDADGAQIRIASMTMIFGAEVTATTEE